MPSPFPGMDPYLEGSEWTSLHIELSSEIARQLAPKVRPKYIVRPARRFVMETWEDVAISTRDAHPDVNITPSTEREAPLQPAATAFTAPLEMVTVVPARIPHVTVEIRDVARRELVTAIEVLSPTNKRGEGYQEYLEKRRRILLSTAHLLEIDLLRNGRRVPMRDALPPAPYFVFLSRAERRPITQVWPIQLDMHLPTVPVPLLEEDADVPLDLQLAFRTVYDALGYDLSVDYTHPPEVPLEEDEATWVQEHLRAQGITPHSSTP